ncbi:hypothetical protein KSP39_PZI007276 [Platanthera zijinensis]|uniref:Uncharacterized protein n=1 Tax=Platanthera zijinensis TaxID=2320716 RepID=A0AAP0BPE5_9ASPA
MYIGINGPNNLALFKEVLNSTVENNGHLEVEVDNSSPNLKQLSCTATNAPDQINEYFAVKLNEDAVLTSEIELDLIPAQS